MNGTRTNTRRDFLKRVAVGAAGAGIMMRVPAASYARIIGANDRVRVGIVGYSDRARDALIPSFFQHAKELNFDIVAVSDIWNRRREEGAAALSELAGHPVTAMRNNEELYESGQTDAVIISTADFQHALHAVEAVEAGQDVYV